MTKKTEWMPIELAPKDTTPVDLWCDGERLCNMRRVELSPGNVFYDPIKSGVCTVRKATHFMFLPDAPKESE